MLSNFCDIDKLPDWRREQALRFKHEHGQWECAASYLLLCELLRDTYGIDTQPHFVIGDHGKPALQEYPHIHFNISHCKKAVAVAVSDEPVGIDVECTGRMKDSLARHVLCDEEYAFVMAAADPDLEFTSLWTRKEALVKLTGEGLNDDLKNLLYNYNNVEIETTHHDGFVLSVAGSHVRAVRLLER